MIESTKVAASMLYQCDFLSWWNVARHRIAIRFDVQRSIMGASLRGSCTCRADASVLNPLAVRRQRFDTVAVLISCGPLCDPQAHDSHVTRVVWSEGVFL